MTVDPSELAILDARRGPRTEGKRTGGSAGFVFSYRRATRAVSSRKDGLGRPVRLFERTDEDFGDTMFGGFFLVAARSACCSANSLLYVFVAQTGLTREVLCGGVCANACRVRLTGKWPDRVRTKVSQTAQRVSEMAAWCLLQRRTRDCQPRRGAVVYRQVSWRRVGLVEDVGERVC